MKTRVTISDIAKLAGVSHSSVSRVLNNAPIRISDSRREQIIEIARRMNYIPNHSAKALKTGKHQTIAVIAYDITDAFAIECVSAMEKCLADTEYHAMWMSCTYADKSRINALDLLYEVAQSVDGIIIVSPGRYFKDADIIKFWATTNKPVVTVIHSVPGDMIPSVRIDNRLGTELLMEYLFDLGHRRIAFCYSQELDPSVDQRYKTYKSMIVDRGFELEESMQIPIDGSVQSGYEAGIQLLKSKQLPTAIIGFRDLASIGLLKACYDCRLNIPGQISIASFDNIRMSENVAPSLTTIAPDYHEMAQLAIEEIIARTEMNEQAPDAAQHFVTVPKLIVRDSTGKTG